MRNGIFVMSRLDSRRFAIKQKEEGFFRTSNKVRYSTAMEDEMIDYGFEEDSVREKLKATREILLFKLLTFRDV